MRAGAAYGDDVGFDDDGPVSGCAEVPLRRGSGRVAQGSPGSVVCQTDPWAAARSGLRLPAPSDSEAEQRLVGGRGQRVWGADGHRSGLSGRGERVVRVGAPVGRVGGRRQRRRRWCESNIPGVPVGLPIAGAWVTSGCGYLMAVQAQSGVRRFPRVLLGGPARNVRIRPL